MITWYLFGVRRVLHRPCTYLSSLPDSEDPGSPRLNSIIFSGSFFTREAVSNALDVLAFDVIYLVFGSFYNFPWRSGARRASHIYCAAQTHISRRSMEQFITCAGIYHTITDSTDPFLSSGPLLQLSGAGFTTHQGQPTAAEEDEEGIAKLDGVSESGSQG